MRWLFSFITFDRRELGDYEYEIEVIGYDSFAKAKKAAISCLPLGEEDNYYSKLGVTWTIQKAEVLDVDKEYYTNDEPQTLQIL